jgi:hypothetical protein
VKSVEAGTSDTCSNLTTIHTEQVCTQSVPPVREAFLVPRYVHEELCLYLPIRLHSIALY